MELTLFSACLPELSLREVAVRARGLGYTGIEGAAWPLHGKGYSPCTVDVDALSEMHERSARVVAANAAEIQDVMGEYELHFSALSFYGNMIHHDREERERNQSHLVSVIDAAAALNVGLVGTFIGRDSGDTLRGSRLQAEDEFPKLVAYARDRGVKLAVENCPWGSQHPDWLIGNIAYSPEWWEWMAETLGVGLIFDPSHLPPLGIDPVQAVEDWVHLIDMFQAKDVEIREGLVQRASVFGSAFETTYTEARPYVHRVPGRGRVDWVGVMGALWDGGFRGDVSVELEDPRYSGSQGSVVAGAQVAFETLSPLMY